MQKRIILAIIVGLAAAVEIGAVSTQRPTDERWRLIRSYVGQIDPAEGIVRASVYAAAKVSDYAFDPTFLQNRIEVRSATRTAEFSWPTSTDFGALTCDVVDLDNDGRKEFLFLAGNVAARVVSYREGRFEFLSGIGQGHGEILSVGPLDVVDLNGDRIVEIVAVGPKGLESIDVRPYPVTVWHWTKQGFREAPPKLAELYKTKFPLPR